MTESNHRVLVVDDDSTVAEMLQGILELEGFEVDTLTQPGAVHDWIRHRPPDLIVLDVMMPEIDGRTLASEIRSDPATADIAIVFCSALSSDQDTWAAWQSGADSYLTKPFDVDFVVTEIQRVLAERAAAKRSGEE